MRILKKNERNKKSFIWYFSDGEDYKDTMYRNEIMINFLWKLYDDWRQPKYARKGTSSNYIK